MAEKIVKIGFPVEILLDEFSLFDLKNKVPIQITVVYDVITESLIEKFRALLPDGRIAYTQIRTKSNLKKLEKIVTLENTQNKARIKSSYENTNVKKKKDERTANVYLDPQDPARYFIQTEDFFGCGHRISSEGPALIILAAAGAAAVGGALGVAAYGISEGYDVNLTVTLDVFSGVELDLSVTKGDSNSDTDRKSREGLIVKSFDSNVVTDFEYSKCLFKYFKCSIGNEYFKASSDWDCFRGFYECLYPTMFTKTEAEKKIKVSEVRELTEVLRREVPEAKNLNDAAEKAMVNEKVQGSIATYLNRIK